MACEMQRSATVMFLESSLHGVLQYTGTAWVDVRGSGLPLAGMGGG
jgi:hypothetical protein